MRTLLFIILSIVLSIQVEAQATYKLFGKLVDATTDEPISFANIYINQTTIGTSSDSLGHFMLDFSIDNANLIISFIGYETIQYPINHDLLNRRLVFKMKPVLQELQEMTVTAERDQEWYNNFKVFRDKFIGTSTFAQSCKIINDKVLIISFTPENAVLNVTSNKPILIENPSLGYTIEYELDYFEYNTKTGRVIYAGYPFFREMKSNSWKQKSWLKNRKSAYNGSLMHFIRSLYQKQTKENGFIAFEVLQVPNPDRPTDAEIDSASRYMRSQEQFNFNAPEHQWATDIMQRKNLPEYKNQLLPNPIKLEDYIEMKDRKGKWLLNKMIQVSYLNEKEEKEYLKTITKAFEKPRRARNQSTILTSQNEWITFYEDGITENPYDLLLQGYWGWEKIDKMLPLDFKVN